MALIPHQNLNEEGVDAFYYNAAPAGDHTVADEEVILHVKVGAAQPNEIQSLTIAGGGLSPEIPDGGTFTLEYDGDVTDPIAYNANAATIELALEALDTIGVGEATVAGDLLAGTLTVTFSGTLVGNVESLVTTDALTFGGDPMDYEIVVTEQSGGVENTNVVIAAVTPCNFNFYHDRVVAVPVNGERFIGPFPRHYWNADGHIYWTYSSSNGVTIAALGT